MSLLSVSRSMRVISNFRVADAQRVWHYEPNDTLTVLAVDFGAEVATLACGTGSACQLSLDTLLQSAVPMRD